MIVSRNEIESLALKASRGAGMSWGLAEEASIAAGWLAEHALPWAGTLAALLAQAHNTSAPQVEGPAITPSRPGTRLCPIVTGALLSDLGQSAAPLQIRDLLAPLWLVPFLASWAGPLTRLSWGDVHLLIAQDSVAGMATSGAATLASAFADRVTITPEPLGRMPASAPRCASSGYDVPDDAWRALQQLEHRTYVPASTQSRLAGAGAGLLDND
jgi:Protein of unknown function (DUF3726)